MTVWLRFADLKARGIVGNWVTLKRWIETQGFPRGQMLGPNTRAWAEQEIEEWLASRPIRIQGRKYRDQRELDTFSAAQARDAMKSPE
jgi:hypothetical protein